MTSNEEVQWYKKQFKAQNDEFEQEMKVRFKEQQTKSRHRRREMMAKYQEEELNKLPKEQK